MTKRELVEAVQKKGLPRRLAEDVVNAILQEFRTGLEAGQVVKLQGIGTFEPYLRGERKGNSFGHAETATVVIPSRWFIRFRAYDDLLDGLGKKKKLG